ncbi:hypothetical protein ACG3T2_16870, partial [Pseudomonas aeruginosa]
MPRGSQSALASGFMKNALNQVAQQQVGIQVLLKKLDVLRRVLVPDAVMQPVIAVLLAQQECQALFCA